MDESEANEQDGIAAEMLKISGKKGWKYLRG